MPKRGKSTRPKKSENPKSRENSWKIKNRTQILIRVKSKRSTDQTMQDIFDLIDKVFILFIHKCL